jgi:sulfur carrier protein ThiS
MKIKVHLYTILKKYGEGKIDENNTIRLPQPLSLQELAAYLNIPQKSGKNFLVNDTPCPGEYILKDGDVVKIFGFICGG